MRARAQLCAAGLTALLTLPAGAATFEDPVRALARLDSLNDLVIAEEARVQRSPRDERAWNRLARAWFQVGDHEHGVQALERSRLLGAHEPETALLLGRVARSEGRYEDALRWLRQAARARPDDWETHEELGLAFYLAGDLPAAADRWIRAGELGGAALPDRSGLIAALRRAGDGAYRVTGRGRETLRFTPETGSVTRRLPLVPVSIAGRGTYLLQLDPGSAEMVIGRSLATELAFDTGPSTTARGLVGGASHSLAYGVLDSLRLGATTVHTVPCGVSDNAAFGGEQGARGTIGLEVLRRFRFAIDYPDSTLRLEPAGAPGDTATPAWVRPADVPHAFPLRMRGTHTLWIPASLAGAPLRPFALDFGGPGVGFTAPASTLAEAQIPIDTTAARVARAAGGEVRIVTLPATSVCLGAWCPGELAGVYGLFPPALERSPTFRIAGILAQGFLANLRVGVDISARRIWLVESDVAP